MGSDYTIKIVGTPLAIEKHRLAIQNFVQSFELMDELPTYE
jgi:hypothetical protein